ELRALRARLADAGEHVRKLGPELAWAQAEWEKARPAGLPAGWGPAEGLVVYYDLDGSTADRAGPCGEAGPCRSAAFRGGEPAYTAGPLGRAAEFDGARFLDAGDAADFGFF